MKNVLDSTKKELYNNLHEYWVNFIDKEHGGFYGGCDLDGNILKESNKGVIYTSRNLWSYSALFNHTKEQKYLDIANDIYKFLIDKCIDKVNGGAYYVVSYDGKVVEADKHLYCQTFCVYGLSEYYIASKNKEALNEATKIAKYLNDSIVDFPTNYNEQFTVDWKRKDNEYMIWENYIPHITTNTILHMVEGLSTLYKASQKEEDRINVKKMLDVLFEYGYDKEKSSLHLFLDNDLKSTKNVLSHGHNIEVGWLFDQVMDVCNLHTKEYDQYCLDLVELTYNEGMDGKAVINETINGVDDKTRVWWVQAESLTGYLFAYEKTKNEKYLKAFYDVFEYTKEKFMSNGEWPWERNEKEEILSNHSKAGPWKATYHNFRALIEVLIRGEK